MSRVPIRLTHVDLAGGVPALAAERGIAGRLVVFWWRDLPLGQRDVPAALLPLPPAAVRELALDTATAAVGDRVLERGFTSSLPERHPLPQAPPHLDDLVALDRIFDRAYARVEQMEREAPPLTTSVVVCTRGRPDGLRRCLASLAALDPAPDEVVVVDNAPTDDATRRVTEEAAGVVPVRYVVERQPGLSAARNAGIAHSTGEVVAFTDDDVEVHPTWLRRLRGAFDAADVWAATGLVLPSELETEAQLLFEGERTGYGWSYRALTFDRGFFDRMRRYAAPVWQIGAGANMAFRRVAFDAVGGFDERLGAGASGCSEDSELWHRILAAGGRCRYEPAAVVFHEHRRTVEALRSQLYAYMRGHVAALLVQHAQGGGWGNLRRAFVTLPRYYGTWVLRRALGNRRGPRLIGTQLRGWAAGFGYYLRHRRSPAERTPLSPPLGRARALTMPQHKSSRGAFLARNPFPHPYTLGFFYREKMRAIHRVAPDRPLGEILEVGGGRSGLTAMLYPEARVTNLDLDPSFADAPFNRQPRVTFVAGDATALPFPDASFDAVTMFDLIEHVPDDRRAMAEAWRVLRPGGALLVSTPHTRWRYPYYGVLRPYAPSEEELFAEWGHVRRGYTLEQLEALVGRPASAWATFINFVTALGHDVAFSRLPRRRALCAALAPLTWAGYALHRPHAPGTETAVAWEKAGGE